MLFPALPMDLRVCTHQCSGELFDVTKINLKEKLAEGLCFSAAQHTTLSCRDKSYPVLCGLPTDDGN